tara:strand:- start:193 stop:450 length:258 start_codon:yes stop_codon:yes gene_type:complete
LTLDGWLDKTGGIMSEQPTLFGEVALEKGYVSVADLYEALTIQARLDAAQEPYRFLGEILSELGYMSEKQVLKVLNELHKEEKST